MFVFCLALWMVFNGRITWETVAFGVVVSAALTWFYRRLTGIHRKKEWELFRKLPGFFRLLGDLFMEMIRANMKVARMVYRRKKTDSCLESFDVPLKTTAARVALSDCITLTPGTITADLDGSRLTVHCLDRSLGENLDRSCFVEKLRSLERREDT